ncbi:unnamed protein product, partial [Meganyctiphanes norvegica]
MGTSTRLYAAALLLLVLFVYNTQADGECKSGRCVPEKRCEFLNAKKCGPGMVCCELGGKEKKAGGKLSRNKIYSKKDNKIKDRKIPGKSTEKAKKKNIKNKGIIIVRNQKKNGKNAKKINNSKNIDGKK